MRERDANIMWASLRPWSKSNFKPSDLLSEPKWMAETDFDKGHVVDKIFELDEKRRIKENPDGKDR